MKGYAALITIDFEKQDVMWTIFEEEPDRPDPLFSAQALGRSVTTDWPSYEQHVIGNERASDLQVERLLGPFVAVRPPEVDAEGEARLDLMDFLGRIPATHGKLVPPSDAYVLLRDVYAAFGAGETYDSIAAAVHAPAAPEAER